MILRGLIKDSAIYGGADLATKVIAFLTFPLIAAVLSPEEFGAMELIGTGTALFGMFANCGLNNAVQRFYWDKDTVKDDQPAIVTSGFFALLFFTIISILLGLIALPWINSTIEKEKLPITWIAVLAALCGMAFTQWIQYSLDVIRLHFAPFRFLLVSLSFRVLSIFIGLLTILILGWRVDGMLSAQAIVMFVVVIFALFVIKKDFKPHAFSWKWVKELTKFGYPFIFAGLAYWLFGAIDRWMLATMTSVEEVGIYSVAFRFSTIVVFLSTAFGQAWSPSSIKMRTDHPDRYPELFGQVLVLLLFAMLVVGGAVSLFSGEMIHLIMPQKYEGSALPLAVLCFGVIVQASQQVTAVGISLEKKSYLFARLIWVAAMLNSAICFLLIPRYGALGAACATSVSHLALTIAYTYYTQKYHPLRIPWGQIGLVFFFLFLFILISYYFSSEKLWSLVFLGKLIFFISFLVIGYFFLVKPNLKLANVT